MKEQFHNLVTNTTSLVGYIAVLMFVGAYLGGDKSYALNPTLLKGSILENRSLAGALSMEAGQSVIITINGKQYEAVISGDLISESPTFTY